MAQMRGFFPLPFGSPQATGAANVVTLASGQTYVLPPGEWALTTGSQTIVQWFEPDNYQWRNMSGPTSFEQISSDGANYRLVNWSGIVQGANITNAGSGGTNGIGPIQTGSTVTFGAPAAGGATATAQGYVVVGGTVPAPTVTQGGSGFLVPPIVCCDPPPLGGVQATFTCTITAAGVLSTVTQVNPGAGYLSVPLFYIIPQPMFYQGAIRYAGDTPPAYPPPPGLINPANVWTGSPFQANIQTGTTGALLTGVALTGSGTLTAVVMTYQGNGYTGATIPTITFGGTAITSAAATSIMSMCANATTMTGNGTNFTVGNAAESSLGTVALTSVNNTFFSRPIRGIISNANGSFTVEDPGFGLQKVPTYGVLTNVALGAQTASTFTTTQIGGLTDTSVLQPMAQ